MRQVMKTHSLPMVSSSGIDYLMEDQVNALTKSFQDWYDASGTDAKRMSRGKYCLTYLTLRYTGARLREVQLIDDQNPQAEIPKETRKEHSCPIVRYSRDCQLPDGLPRPEGKAVYGRPGQFQTGVLRAGKGCGHPQKSCTSTYPQAHSSDRASERGRSDNCGAEYSGAFCSHHHSSLSQNLGSGGKDDTQRQRIYLEVW